jgi:hypothetical protein
MYGITDDWYKSFDEYYRDYMREYRGAIQLIGDSMIEVEE